MPYTEQKTYKEIGFISGLSAKEYAYNMTDEGDYKVMVFPGIDKDNYADFLVFVDGVLFNKNTEIKFDADKIMIDKRYIGNNSRVVVFNRRNEESYYSYQKEINKNVGGLEKTSYVKGGNDFYLICITENNNIRLHDKFLLSHHTILSDSIIDNTVDGFTIDRQQNHFIIRHNNKSMQYNDDRSIQIWNTNEDDNNKSAGFDNVISEKDLGGKFFYIDDIYHSSAHGGNYINVIKLFNDTHTINRVTFDATLLTNNTSTIT